MNVKQLRQVLEQVLGYYDYGKASNGSLTRTARNDAPGFYYQDGSLVCPAFFVQGRQRVSSSWDVKGLEALLVEKPRTRIWGHIGALERWQHWTLYLQQFDLSKEVREYELKVLRHFAGDAQSTYWRKNDEDLSDRVMITIKTVDFDLVEYPLDAALNSVPSPVENSPQSTFFDQ
jgi:hypothetical protein